MLDKLLSLLQTSSGEFKKAEIIVCNTKKKIEVMYNPEQLVLGKRARVTGEGAWVWFDGVESDDFVVSLFFDTYEKGSDVRKKTNEITALVEPSLAAGKGKVPPTVQFMWGGPLPDFTGIVTHVEQKFTMFAPSGLPVRAELTVTFKEVLTEQQELKAKGLVNCRLLWTVTESDRLHLIAQQAYGDATLWRLIADANGIYDPLGFPGTQWIGSTLVVPDIHGETFEPLTEPSYV
jgi:hypothetical protein